MPQTHAHMRTCAYMRALATPITNNNNMSMMMVLQMRKLMEMMIQSYRQHKADAVRLGAEWNLDTFRFLGRDVCRQAFLLLTGIGNSSLQAARRNVLMNKVSSHGSHELSRWLLIRSHAKPAMYLDCRQ